MFKGFYSKPNYFGIGYMLFYILQNKRYLTFLTLFLLYSLRKTFFVNIISTKLTTVILSVGLPQII